MATLIFTSCKDDVLPKPKGYLKLEYPEATYKKYLSDCPFTFDINNLVEIEKPRGQQQYCGVNLSYPGLKGKIDFSYVKGVDSKKFLDSILSWFYYFSNLFHLSGIGEIQKEISDV